MTAYVVTTLALTTVVAFALAFTAWAERWLDEPNEEGVMPRGT